MPSQQAQLKQPAILTVYLAIVCAFCMASCANPTELDSTVVSETYVIPLVVGNQLCTINTDGSDLRVVATGPPGSSLPWHPQISPDGSKLVYQFADTTYQQIFLFDRTTEKTKNITNDNVFHETPVFSPDGQTIVFATAQGWLQNLCSYDLRTTTVTQLTYRLNCHDPSFSKDGSQIVFYLGNGLDSNGVGIIEKDGNNFRFLGLGGDPTFFPNGNKILFQNATSAYDNGLFAMNADGSNRLFYVNVPWQSNASISPDGSKIIAEYFAGNREIIIINSDGTGFTNITKDTAAEYCPMFLRSEKTIMYVVSDTSRTYFLDQSSLDGTNRRHVFQSKQYIYLYSF